MKIKKLIQSIHIPNGKKFNKKYTRSHLTHALNHRTHKAIRWCTPSIDLKSSQVKKPYLSDTSISYETLGFPSEPSGVFKKIFDQAAKVYGADHTLFTVNGTTGSNFIVLRALSKQFPNLRVLAARNVHRSIVAPCEDYGINLMFLPTNIDQDLQIFLPNTDKEIMEGIRKTKPQVLLLTNPTYEGISLNLKKIIARIRRKYPDLIIFVEEAWGAHLHFSNKLPISAMEAGADICVQSTHKQGGALQQASMIHWKDERVNMELLMDSYRNLSTSSPSFLLLASLDAARELMEKLGKKRIDHILTIANELTEKINGTDGFEVVSTNMLRKKNSSIFSRDETKVIVNVAKAGFTGFEIANLLEKKFKIIVEKYNYDTILLLVPFRATMIDVQVTISALEKLAANFNKRKQSIEFNLKIPTNTNKILEMSDVTKLFWSQIEKVPLVKAEGRISAENITPYLPGIPLTIKGEEFTSELVNYYLKLREYPNAHIIAQDKTLETVWVVK
jgi:lysine decarboxylase